MVQEFYFWILTTLHQEQLLPHAYWDSFPFLWMILVGTHKAEKYTRIEHLIPEYLATYPWLELSWFSSYGLKKLLSASREHIGAYFSGSALFGYGH